MADNKSMMSKNRFVFVVCGGDKHIHTLHVALRYLRHFTNNPIIVVTDQLRNRIPIIHDEIIYVDTPLELNHHEASIFLKTSLHRILNPDFNYCYLDSDVIAIKGDVNRVFEHRNGPVTFASDHCTIDKFSPYAMACGCLNDKLKKQGLLEESFKEIIPNYDSDDQKLQENVRELKRLFARVYNKPLANIPFITRSLINKYVLPGRYFDLTEKFRYDKQEKTWLDDNGRVILCDILKYYKLIEKKVNLKYQRLGGRWLDEKGENVYNTKCDHLIEKVKSKFGIDISNRNWRHWSGGVFLFDKNSSEFMDTWHKYTMDAMQDPQWQTRDQGTLAATVWKYNLQDQKRLPITYNFIADYFDAQLSYSEEHGYQNGYSSTPVHPYFIHVYHEFGRKGWDIWDSIAKLDPLITSEL